MAIDSEEDMPALESCSKASQGQIGEQDSEMENYEGTIQDLYSKNNFVENSSKS